MRSERGARDVRDGGRHRKIRASRAPHPLCAYFMLLGLKNVNKKEPFLQANKLSNF